MNWTVLALVAVGMLLLAGVTVGVLGLYTSVANRPRGRFPRARWSRAQRRVAATQARERGDTDATDVIPVVNDDEKR